MSTRILHIITSLDVGGAQVSLLRLLSHLGDQFTSEVVSLTTENIIGKQIRELGIPVHALGLRPGVPDPRLVTRLAGVIRRFQPDLIQTWMYHADLSGGLAARIAGSPPVIWNIRHSLGNLRDLKSSTRLVVKACALASHCLPVKIICNAQAGLRSHAAVGYDIVKMLVIPNGFDLEEFHPDLHARLSVRHELGLPDETILIGLCGRFHPQKDHENFLQAAGILHRNNPEIRFVLWGKDVYLENTIFQQWISHYGLGECVHLLGPRTDSPRLNAALDIATLSAAFGEAFPNVVGEAMACEVPCVVTDVGDAALIVGDTGKVVPVRSASSLADAWEEMLIMPYQERILLGKNARKRMVEHFSLKKTTAAYAGLYQDIIQPAREK
jgi:glycosyltransferase involved in cell wall biosynthesis